MSRLSLATVLAIASLAGISYAADGDVPAVQYKELTTYQCVKEPYELAVPRLSRCGHCYYVYITAYRTKTVPVTKRVKVCP
jgi:hypothetical protein